MVIELSVVYRVAIRKTLTFIISIQNNEVSEQGIVTVSK